MKILTIDVNDNFFGLFFSGEIVFIDMFGLLINAILILCKLILNYLNISELIYKKELKKHK